MRGGGVSGEVREMMTMISTELVKDEKVEAPQINRAFSVILLRYAIEL